MTPHGCKNSSRDQKRAAALGSETGGAQMVCQRTGSANDPRPDNDGAARRADAVGLRLSADDRLGDRLQEL